MTVESIRAALNARPFQPFTITTAAQQTYRITSPEWCLYRPEVPRTLVVMTPNGGTIVLDVLMIPTFEFDPVPVR